MTEAVADPPMTPSAEPTPIPIDWAITVRDLSKKYRIEKVAVKAPHAGLLDGLAAPFQRLLGRGGPKETAVKEFWALDGVTFDIARGERVAVIGRNGAGKTTLLKILSRIVTPTRGEARIRGRLTSLLEVGTGFQDALTGRENVYVNASMHGLSRKETDTRFDEIATFSGIEPRFLDMRVKHYSSGMRVRLAFSVAAHLDPDILLLDEVLAVGDIAFQEKCLERVEGMMREQRTVLLVSHDMSSVTRFCQRAIWVEQGRVVMDGLAKDVAAAYTEQARKAVTARRWSAGSQEEASASPPTSAPAVAGTSGSDPGAPQGSFVSVCLIDADHRELKAPTVDQRFGIEFVYDVLADDKLVLPAATFHNAEEVHLFTSVYTEEEQMRKPKARGRYVSVLWIPPHLLNTGLTHISVSLTTPTSGKLERHVVIDKALTFDIFEAPFGARSARGVYRDVKGAVRPLLDWETRPA